jgi:O-antigen/teichoic acid export membrane protein
MSPFGSRVLLTMAMNVALALMGLVTGILAARLLGPQGRGELATIQLWPGFIAAVAMLGLSDGVVYFSARNPEQAGRYTGAAMALAVLVSPLAMVIGYVLLPTLLAAQSADLTVAARWYLWIVPIVAVMGIPHSLLRGRDDFVAWNALRILPSGGWLVVLLTAWLIGWSDAALFAGGYLVALGLLFVPLMYVVTRRISGPFNADPRLWGQMLRYGIPSMASSMPQMLKTRLDQMLIAVVLPAQALGLYVTAIAWASAGQLLVSALGSVILPRVASQAAADQQRHALAQTSRLATGLAVSMAGGVVVLTPLAIPLLFGVGFSGAVLPAGILTVASTVASVNLVLEEGLRGLGTPAIVLKAELLGLAATGAGLFTALQPFGIAGAALASLIGQLGVMSILLLETRKLTGSSIRALLIPSRAEIRGAWGKMHAVRREVRIMMKRDAI